MTSCDGDIYRLYGGKYGEIIDIDLHGNQKGFLSKVVNEV